MGTTTLVVIAIVLFVVVIFQLARTSDYVSSLRGEEKSQDENNKVQGLLFMIFLIVGLVAMVWSLFEYGGYMIMKSNSVHGRWIDSMFNVTLFFTGIVFIITQVMLFYFSWKYRGSSHRQARYYPEDNRLEMWWTVVPAIVLTTLVTIGIYRWFQITGPEPPDSMVVEITGQQFTWNYRYPGSDNKLGNYEFEYITAINKVGIDFEDAGSKDDFMATEMHMVVNKPTLLRIRSRDVIHDVGIPWLRVKMDAVPGLVTRFHFIPTVTTAEMRARTGNPDWNYEITCNQLCGQGHFGMRGVVVVETQAEYDKWMAQQKSFYETSVKGTDEEKIFAELIVKRERKLAEEAAKGKGGHH